MGGGSATPNTAPPDGDPLLLFHGTPGSRYATVPDPPLLEAYDIRLISLEQPGFGLSTFDPDRELLDWPCDVQEATVALGLDQFALLRGSGGGPYVLNLHIDEKLRRDLPNGSARVKILGALGAYEVDWWSPEPGDHWEPVERGGFDDVEEPDEVSHLS